MAKHLYLPEMEGNVAEPPDAGVWHGYDRKVLRAVGDGIVVGENAVGRGISSVPDVWARPLLVQSALRPDSKHPLRARLVQEWRGLLSLLALHKVRGDDVKVVPVTLDDRPFARALRRLLPRPASLERGVPYAWTDVLLIRYEGIPVGGFSPTTLVYPASDYARRLATTKLSLRDEHGRLAPPSAAHPEELLQVAEWVEQLHARLNGSGTARLLDTGTDNPIDAHVIETINRLLTDWLDELKGTLGRPDGRFDAEEVRVAAEPMEISPMPPFAERYRVYREVLRPLESTGASGPPSDLLLSAGEERRRRSAPRTVVVITPGLLRTGGRVWGRRLRDMGGTAEAAIAEYFRAPSGTRIGRDELPHDALWVRPELYFLTDTLTVSATAAPLLEEAWGAPNGGQRHALLPFTPELLDFFTPAEVQHTLEPTLREIDGGYTFSFVLPVGGRRERVQKTYLLRNPGVGEGSVVRLAAPPVQLFPRYVDRNWRRYYVFQGGAEQVTVDPVVPAGCRTVDRTHRSEASGLTARAVQITGDDPYPEALVFRSAGRTPTPLGLAVVPRPPAQPKGLDGLWRVGIDFGTSNTNVFRQASSSDIAERWRFDFPDYLQDVTVDGTKQRAAVLREFFVPPEAVELPIPTALRLFEGAKRESMLLDFSIYFSSEYELPRNVYTDFKWEGEEESRPKSKLFLDSLLFLILIEVGLKRVDRVELSCSFPKAFSVERLTRFKGVWSGVVKRAFEGDAETEPVLRRRGPGQGETGAPQVSNPAYAAEGVAAGEFFASEKTIENREDRANTRIAAVCLDVGGGTTDISIWYRNEIVFDASVLLAGRQISQRLQQNPRVLDVIFSSAAAKALAEKRNEPAAFAARLNVVLKKEEEAIRERLIDRASNSEVQWMRRILALEFGAIAFYTASLLGAADRTKQGGIAREMQESGISMHWGGNAAKLINWIDFGRYDRNGIASKLLNALVLNTLREMQVPVAPAGLVQRQSPGHKSEAAGGLVVIDPTHLREDDEEPRAWQHDDLLLLDEEGGDEVGGAASIVCGEDIELTTGPVGHLDRISERTLFDGSTTRFRRTSLTRLSLFVDYVNRLGTRIGFLTDDSRIRLDDARKIAIANDVRGHFVEMERTREGRRVIEPVFILEVKILLDYLRNELR